MKKTESGYTLVALVFVVLWLAVIGGWVANIVKFVGMDFNHITEMLVVRGVGIFLAPLGAVLGFIPA